jgi:hypothetical protein
MEKSVMKALVLGGIAYYFTQDFMAAGVIGGGSYAADKFIR